MLTTIRTLRLEISKRGRPNALIVPAQQEVARETLTPLFSMNWASHLLRGECQVVRKGKRKIFRSYRISKNELESSLGGYNLSLWDPSSGEGEFGVV